MTRRGLLLFAAMCVIWGIPYLFIRVAVGELTPATLVFVRTGVAALILMPSVLRRGGRGQVRPPLGAPIPQPPPPQPEKDTPETPSKPHPLVPPLPVKKNNNVLLAS